MALSAPQQAIVDEKTALDARIATHSATWLNPPAGANPRDIELARGQTKMMQQYSARLTLRISRFR